MTRDPQTGKMVVDQNAVAQQQIDHLYAVANSYVQRGYPELAQPYLFRAQALEGIVKQGQQNANILGRQETMADYRNTMPLNSWQQYQQGLNQQFGAPGMREPWGYRYLSPYQRDELRLRSQPGGKPSTPEQAQAAQVKWREDFAKATKSTLQPKYKNPDGKAIPGSPMTGKGPEVSAKDISDIRSRLQAARTKGYNGPLDPFSAIDASPDPIGMSNQLSQLTGNQTLKSLLQARGRAALMQRSSQGLGSQPGGSDGSENPTNGGAKLPQRMIWDMLIENGATPEEATTLTAIAYAESGGDPGNVNPTDNNGKQTSWGLFQISDGTHNEPAGWDDPETNTRMAIAKLRSRQGLHAWGSYNSGAYESYLPNAQAAP